MLNAVFAAAVMAAQHRVVSGNIAASSSVAVVSAGRIVYDRAVGVRDLGSGEPATPQTIYRIGSITKLFTAVSAMQLVDAGKLSLDERLAHFYPQFPNAAKITVRDLLMHRSGIPDYLDAALSKGETQRPRTPAQIIAMASRQTPAAAPETVFSYSNTNYVLLGQIVERVSGMPLEAYERKHIFEPAGMHSTYIDGAPSGRAVATGYHLPSRTPEHFDLTWAYGCGDVLSTAADVARFDIALMSGSLLRAQTFEKMIAAAKPTGDGYGYGLGIMLFPLGSTKLVGHHGGLPGFEADDEMLPGKGFAVISLGNDFGYPTGAAINAALLAEDPADTKAAATAAQAAQGAQATASTAVTARLDAFFAQLLKGGVDAGQLTPAMRSALTPDAVASLRALYGEDGSFLRLQFQGEDVMQGLHRYRYTAIFARGTKDVMFVLDGDGKIAGVFDV